MGLKFWNFKFNISCKLTFIFCYMNANLLEFRGTLNKAILEQVKVVVGLWLYVQYFKNQNLCKQN